MGLMGIRGLIRFDRFSGFSGGNESNGVEGGQISIRMKTTINFFFLNQIVKDLKRWLALLE